VWRAAKEILHLTTAIAVREPADMTPEALDGLADDIGNLYTSLARAYFG